MPDTDSPTLPTARLADTLEALGFRPSTPQLNVEESLRTGLRTYRVRASERSMGTRVEISVHGSSRDRAEQAVGRAFEEMRRLVRLLDRHGDGSAVSELNASGSLDRAPPELLELLHGALWAYTLSGEAFDVTVQPLVDLMRRRGSLSPDDPELAEASQLVDASAVTLSGTAVRLARTGMGVTLDGIAKGYVVDRMADVLRSHGARSWLIEAGGDIRASGSKRQTWRVGVRDPSPRSPLASRIALTEGAIATSGAYESFFERGRGSHHIVDFRTRRSPVAVASATVTAPTTMLADVLATTCVVLDPAAGRSLIDSLPACACLLLDAEGVPHTSAAWPGQPTSNL